MDSNRRFLYDAGGTKPLTQFPLVPVTVVLPLEVHGALKELSDRFIDPNRNKPYGVGAVARILIAITIASAASAPKEELLEYFKGAGGVSGRPTLSEKTKRIALLIPKPLVDRMNARVEDLDEPLIGTATVIRWLIGKGIKRVQYYQLYEHIPTADMAFMIKEKLTIDTVIERFQRRQIPSPR